MKKIMHLVKICLAIILILLAAYSLSSFGRFLDLILGTVLMLTGVALAVILEGRRSRLFFLFSIFSVVLTAMHYFFHALPHLQYLAGGFLVYFACSIAFNRKTSWIV